MDRDHIVLEALIIFKFTCLIFGSWAENSNLPLEIYFFNNSSIYFSNLIALGIGYVDVTNKLITILFLKELYHAPDWEYIFYTGNVGPFY